MTQSPTKYGILTGVDGSPAAEAAVAWAAREAVNRHEHLTLAHVAQPVSLEWPPPLHGTQNEISRWQDDNAQQVIEQARRSVAAATGASQAVEVRTLALRSNVVAALVDASREASMIVVGSRGGTSLGRLLLGSVSAGLLHHAYCPVVVAHAGDGPPPGPDAPVLLGVDGSPVSEAATAWAFDAASRRNAPLLVLHAWSDVRTVPLLDRAWDSYESQGDQVLAERLAGWQERYPDVHITRRLVRDAPARWLLEESERAQLVVVGSRGRGGFSGMLLGSVSSEVAQTAAAPVAVVRPR
ncbi:MAG: universal stress protein [Mycobacterium sp.]